MEVYGMNGGQSPVFRGATFTSDSQTESSRSGMSASEALRRAAKIKAQYAIKKKFNYNMREISSQILRAKKAQSASIVLVRAKAKVSSVKRCLGTGQYNDNEVRPALAHAQRMVLVASKKLKNLKEEERESRKLVKQKQARVLEHKREAKSNIIRKKQEKEMERQIEEMQEIRQEKMRRQAMEQKRRMHRNNERGKIAEADMRYIKDQMDDKWDNQDWKLDLEGVVWDISSSAASLMNLENTAMMLSGEGGEMLLGADASAASMPVEGGAVDISL